MPGVTYAAVLCSLALAGAIEAAGVAGAQEPVGVRAAATGSVQVSAANRTKYKLASKTIAKGTGIVTCGEAQCLSMRSTAAVRKKLKGGDATVPGGGR